MTFPTKGALAAVVAATLAFGTIGAVWAAGDPIAERKALMKANGGAFGGVMVKMAKGETAYDAAAVKAALAKIDEDAKGFAALFPKGSETGGETAASPKIWEDPKGFQAELAKLRTVVAAQSMAAGTDLAGLKVAVGEIGKVCSSCHETYRIKK
jgi:cytochrome c556